MSSEERETAAAATAATVSAATSEVQPQLPQDEVLYREQEQREAEMNLVWDGPNGINPKRVRLFHVRGIIGRNVYFRETDVRRLYFTIHDNLALVCGDDDDDK